MNLSCQKHVKKKKSRIFLQFIREIKLATDREAPCRCNLTSFICQDFGADHAVFLKQKCLFRLCFFKGKSESVFAWASHDGGWTRGQWPHPYDGKPFLCQCHAFNAWHGAYH